MDLAEWLRALDLQRYEAAFTQHDITLELLPSLTAEDLKELGVASIGHRRRILDAAAALRDRVISESEPPFEEPLAPSPERRPLSLMFCDLVGSTELASRHDPEDYNDIIKAYQTCVQEQTSAFAGFIAHYAGDGVLVYFGWPNSSETDAERAILAALGIVEAVGRMRVLDEDLRVRIGIATGLVLVGEQLGTGAARQHAAIGDTPNLAARLQALAKPGDVIIDAATRHRVGELFEYESLGAVALKGLPGPVPAWRVLRERRLENRFEALRGMQISPLIGREEELELLGRRWSQARAGEFQVVLLGGEAGIGKSRLVTSLIEQLGAEPHFELRYFCSPDHTEDALYPVIMRWERAAGITREDTQAEKLAKLEATLVARGTSPEDIALIATLLGIPTENRYPPITLGPQRRKTRTIDALIRQLRKAAECQPVLMLVEDAHWADPSSIDLLNRVIAEFAQVRLMALISFRPEFKPPWVGKADVTLITLNRLTRRQAGQLASHVAADNALSPTLLDRVIEQSDGVPLFIEELTKTVLETTVEPQGAESPATVPATLQSSLMIRLNRLPTAKKVAEVGAVIGREFSHALLGGIAQIPDAQLRRGLDELIAAGLVSCRGATPDAVYAFKHALVLDAAYQFMLRTERRELHLRAALYIQDRLSDMARLQPGIIAHHYSRAGRQAEAARWFIAAGDLAYSRYAHPEARSQYGRALDALGSQPSTDEDRRLLVDATLKQTAVSLVASNPAQHLEPLRVAEAIAQGLLTRPEHGAEDELRLLKIRFWLGRAHHHLGTLPEAIRYYEGVLASAASSRDDELIGVCRSMVGRVLLIQGRYGQAKRFLEQALPILERKELFAEYLYALSYLGSAEAAIGDYAAGLQAVQRAERVATELNFATGLAGTKLLLWGVHFHAGNSLGMLEAARSVVPVAERTGERLYEYLGYGMLAWAQIMQGDPELGLLSLERCREMRTSLGGCVFFYDWFSALYAQTMLLLGRPAEAVQAAHDAIEEASKVQGIFAEGLARRTLARAMLALHAGQWEAAQAQLQSSLQLFAEGEARTEEARTHLEWALLAWRHASRNEAATHFAHAAEQFARVGLEDELHLAERRYAECLAS